MFVEIVFVGVCLEEVFDILEVLVVELLEVKEEEVEKEFFEWEELLVVLLFDKNVIFFFGMFIIFDNVGCDIIYMFSFKLCIIFLYILLNSVGKRGVFLFDMNQIFWFDKFGSNVKNFKGVFMNYVRKILQDVDGIEFVYCNGYFCMVFGEEFYCDYICLMNFIFLEKKKKEIFGVICVEWLEIFLWGKFIFVVEFDFFDYYKQKVEMLIYFFLFGQLELVYWDVWFSIVICFCNIFFIVDFLLDLVFVYIVCVFWKQNNQEEVIRCYVVFMKDYRWVMNEEYGIVFVDIKV